MMDYQKYEQRWFLQMRKKDDQKGLFFSSNC